RVAGARTVDVRGVARARYLPGGRLRRHGRRVPGDRQPRRRPAPCRRPPARDSRRAGVKTAGPALLLLVAVLALGAPWLSPNDPNLRFPGHNYAPPSTIHYPGVIHAVRSVSRLERTFATDESVRVSLRWFANGRLVTTEGEPLLLLGADA